MNKELSTIVSQLNKLSFERQRLNTLTEKINEEIEDCSAREDALIQKLFRIEAGQKELQDRFNFVMLNLNTQLPYRKLRKIYDLTDGPLI